MLSMVGGILETFGNVLLLVSIGVQRIQIIFDIIDKLIQNTMGCNLGLEFFDLDFFIGQKISLPS